jgi:hypothetical protein
VEGLPLINCGIGFFIIGPPRSPNRHCEPHNGNDYERRRTNEEKNNHYPATDLIDFPFSSLSLQEFFYPSLALAIIQF